MRQYLETSIIGRKKNAFLSGILVLYLLANSFNILLDGALIWSVYAFSVLLLAVIPSIVKKDLTALPPFEVLLLLALPFSLKGMQIGFVASHTLNYLVASGVALLVITELDTYRSFETTPNFAVWLVALTTVASSGFWAVGRWLSDTYLGTSFIISEKVLMWEFTSALIAGIIAGLIFRFYFRKKDRRLMKHEN